jgi:hypothetical protein
MVFSGWVVAHEGSKFILLALVGVLVLAFSQRGALVGLLTVAAMNGLPFIDTSQVVSSKLTVADVAIISLLFISVAWGLLDRAEGGSSSTDKALTRAGLLLLIWWLFTLGRSITTEHVALMHAAAFGRDFLYFALLLLVLPKVQLTSRDVAVLISILVAAACLYALGQIATATGLGQAGSLIHYQYTASQSGLTRLYSNMTDLVMASLAAALLACLLAPRRSKIRSVAIPIAALLTVSVVVQLTRARWVGLVLGFLVVGVWVAARSDVRVSALLRKRLALAAGAIGIAVAAALLLVPDLLSGGGLAQRLLSTVSDLQAGSGTVAVREAATKAATGYLGHKWPIGLGLVPPSSHYYAGLPEGSLRDTDLGVLGAVMTMGVTGAVLIYYPVVITLSRCLRTSRGPLARFYWLQYGGAVWAAATLISSFTLVTLFSASGLTLTAVILVVVSHPSVIGASERHPSLEVAGAVGRRSLDPYLPAPSSIPTPSSI